MIKKKPCVCCGYLTISDANCFEICNVCAWQDDMPPDCNPYDDLTVNGLSLYEARNNYQLFGAISENDMEFVRPPLPEEIPPTGIPRFPPIPPPTREELLKEAKTGFIVDPNGNIKKVEP